MLIQEYPYLAHEYITLKTTICVTLFCGDGYGTRGLYDLILKNLYFIHFTLMFY